MKANGQNLNNYLKKIYTIIFLTNILALLFVILNFRITLGWFFGCIGSCVNFYLQSIAAKKTLNLLESNAKIYTFKIFYLRYGLLFLYLIIVIKFLPVNLLAVIAGLFSVQIAIYIEMFYRYISSQGD
ncbi:MAG: hypothetical protein DRH57_05765 [Candidatus Cloacimonadota bacterium]|nr:MAG: hypothetical protein DRH57_05765 [Candidatus Cloacimonadota bacterium]